MDQGVYVRSFSPTVHISIHNVCMSMDLAYLMSISLAYDLTVIYIWEGYKSYQPISMTMNQKIVICIANVYANDMVSCKR